MDTDAYAFPVESLSELGFPLMAFLSNILVHLHRFENVYMHCLQGFFYPRDPLWIRR